MNKIIRVLNLVLYIISLIASPLVITYTTIFVKNKVVTFFCTFLILYAVISIIDNLSLMLKDWKELNYIDEYKKILAVKGNKRKIYELDLMQTITHILSFNKHYFETKYNIRDLKFEIVNKVIKKETYAPSEKNVFLLSYETTEIELLIKARDVNNDEIETKIDILSDEISLLSHNSKMFKDKMDIDKNMILEILQFTSNMLRKIYKVIGVNDNSIKAITKPYKVIPTLDNSFYNKVGELMDKVEKMELSESE